MEVMDLVDTKLNSQFFEKITDIDSSQWNAIVPRATGLKHNVLRTFEKSGVNDLVCHYMLFNQADEPVAKANLYEVSMDFTTMDKTLSPTTRRVIKHWHPDFLNLSMIECGLFAMNGDGLVVKDIRQLPDVISLTSKKMHHIAAARNLDLLLFRDVPLEEYSYYEKTLAPLGFHPVAGFTNAVIEISWTSLDGYLDTLNSKTRHKLKSALKIEQKFDIRIEITSDYAHLSKEMAKLWANVNAASDDYSREQLDEAFFEQAGLQLHDNSEVVLFYHHDHLVAFMWNLIGDEDYHMADWGVDYGFPQYREANFYRSASIFSLKRAIELGKKRMQLGMTNYTPKKLLGARMQPLVYFIKHVKNPDFSPTVARMITDAIEQPEELDYYDKDCWPLKKMSAGEYKNIFNQKVLEYRPNDAFYCVEKSYDIDLLKLGGLYSFYPDTDALDIHLSRSSFINYGKHPVVRQAGLDALNHRGGGNEDSPFFAGCSGLCVTLQETIAHLTGKAAVQVLTSGSMIHNVALSALLEADTLVLMDEKNGLHLWEAINATGCEAAVYKHNDMEHLQVLLREQLSRKKLIVTEAVFSLMGDCADLQAIARLKQQCNARIYLDESHGFGLLGARGEGLSAVQGVAGDMDIITASTLPSMGIDSGFIAAPTRIIEHIRHQSTPLMFSSGLSSITLSMLTTALAQLEQDASGREELISKSQHLAQQLTQYGFNVSHYHSPIINITIGDFLFAIAIQKELSDRGVVIAVTGPPMLPPEMSALRITVHADLTAEQLTAVLDCFQEIGAIVHAN